MPTEIYLDANATTPVSCKALDAAIEVMSDRFGNPSSVHGTGLKARVIIDVVRASARRVLNIRDGQLLFVSGATEGIQTAVLSALSSLRERRHKGGDGYSLLLYGATEHKAVPEAIKHWNALLQLNFEVLAIPVGTDGRHDLGWLRAHAPRAGLVCTMAANNETGVISDLDGIRDVLEHSPALWMVDSVQALGKLDLQLARRRIDYAPFSGHKLYAPKGIGMLYVREGAPITPIMAGGGQEGAMRSGTENMPGIAALGAVLDELESGEMFKPLAKLEELRGRLVAALREAFQGIVFNADPHLSLPTTINFSVPGVSSKVLLDLFDAASIRVSGGSACGASAAQPSYVLQAMGLEHWRCGSAVRMSFGPTTSESLIGEACQRILQCGQALRDSGITVDGQRHSLPPDGIIRHVVDGAVCYVVADSASKRCLVIDPLPELTDRLAQWVRCRGFMLVAVLDTHSHGDHASSAQDLWRALPAELAEPVARSPLGWPLHCEAIQLGARRITKLAIPGHTKDSCAYLLVEGDRLLAAFVGDTVMPGALGRSDFSVSAPLVFASSLRLLDRVAGRETLLFPGHDYDDRIASTLSVEAARLPLLDAVLNGHMDAQAFATAKAALERDIGPTQYQTLACGARTDVCEAVAVEIRPEALLQQLQDGLKVVLIDVRERYEYCLSPSLSLGAGCDRQPVPLSSLPGVLSDWLAAGPGVSRILVCRSGARSAKAAQALRRLGLGRTWSVAGGLALWPELAILADAEFTA
ncbi:aminotransferase class V-fold PLP-dependent enzyme [Roseateles sp. SL47]|uniref:aminotransferase class V-fold PLP-dependent enzyme n=1 Tax=Roseateles sp. SL47 TaxID=2995138 RepID=UPI00226FF277|nr:aminotransferase class V-fold PLP-dependent enzyme [Roseateles sp. SL47]WAC75710.1 aminotransferase class V-fold PLP-dependent enzyme [Roseateles sp. SL47]